MVDSSSKYVVIVMALILSPATSLISTSGGRLHQIDPSDGVLNRGPRGSGSSSVPREKAVFGLPTISRSNSLLSAKKGGEENPKGRRKLGKKKGGMKNPRQKKKVKPATIDATTEARSKSKKDAEKQRKKEEIMRQMKSKLNKNRKQNDGRDTDAPNSGDLSKSDSVGLLGKFNPFEAGKSLRQTLGNLKSLGGGLDQQTKQKYYLDDRFLEQSGGVLSERNPLLERLENDNSNYVPEVLVIGATGEVGRLVVRRLLLEGRCRVRVLVRDLFSQTLNLLGTGVTYCQGDLGDMESLEYALTDVDKIVFCAAAPRPDEKDFQEKFQYYLQENLEESDTSSVAAPPSSNLSPNHGLKGEELDVASNDIEWEQLSSVLRVRARLAELVDMIGMKNLVRAYQNVRHADYGTSQSAKRSLFKFSSRPEDFGLFALDDDNVTYLDAGENSSEVDSHNPNEVDGLSSSTSGLDNSYNSYYNTEDYDEYDYDEYDYDDSEGYHDELEARRDASVKSQVKWIRNEFGHGVFVGKVPKINTAGVGGEAAIVSSRLRSREEPQTGIDLSAGFAGFIVRLVGDGSNYEVFVRTGAYDNTGIEYVCEFSTETKPYSRAEKTSRNKFITVRLPFANFKPVLRESLTSSGDSPVVPPFQGSDVRFLGFRYRSASNPRQTELQKAGDNVSFYIALAYVKVYRQQPEPEFVYLSDARIPPTVRNGMVRHDQQKLLTEEEVSNFDVVDGRTDGGNSAGLQILDEQILKEVETLERSPEETYYKYQGEEILKGSGLSYTIVRVAGFNESPSGEASTIDLTTVCPFMFRHF